MARSTRQQRRQRRAQAAGTPPLRPAVRPLGTAAFVERGDLREILLAAGADPALPNEE